MDVITDPSRIFHADESGFSLCPKTGKVLGLRGYNNLHEVKKGNGKNNLIVLVKPPKAISDSMPPDWFLGKSDSGWMKSEFF